mmetsp:Transcript_30285/g.65104  ORF Transcript_30285/g.65104 Transcript_30285/m.65104 type:complete len:116 (-) Transcript_30285:1360-1707(-)
MQPQKKHSMVKKRKATLGRHARRGGDRKAGTTDPLLAARRNAIAAAEEAQNAVCYAAESGIAIHEQAAAAAAARAATRDAVRAKAAVKSRASNSSGSARPRQPRQSLLMSNINKT